MARDHELRPVLVIRRRSELIVLRNALLDYEPLENDREIRGLRSPEDRKRLVKRLTNIIGSDSDWNTMSVLPIISNSEEVTTAINALRRLCIPTPRAEEHGFAFEQAQAMAMLGVKVVDWEVDMGEPDEFATEVGQRVPVPTQQPLTQEIFIPPSIAAKLPF